MPQKRKYLPLSQFLLRLPAEQAQVRLTVAEIETLVGPLPPTARLPTYWSHGTTPRMNWEFDGFRAQLDQHERVVTFTRQSRMSRS